MSFASKRMTQWSQAEVIAWINSLPTDATLTDYIKRKIISGIEETATEMGSPITGKDLAECEDAGDIKELTNVSSKPCNALLKRIDEYEANQFPDGNLLTNNDTLQNNLQQEKFTLNVIGWQSKAKTLPDCRRGMSIKEVKALYLFLEGDQIAADDVRRGKWTDNQISIQYNGQVLQDNSTLESYGIKTQNLMPMTIIFHVRGGAQLEQTEEKESRVRRRRRRLRLRKHPQIKLSKQACCIMSYDDTDGMKRAEMPCGCAIAADSMFRYMKALFERDYYSHSLCCPMPKKKSCRGSDSQRQWPWPLVFAVADLTQKEVVYYSKIINNRASGARDCPHCGTTMDRPKDLRIWRVNCTACSSSDWCWACGGTWKASGMGPICGNDKCMGAQMNVILAQCEKIVPSWGSDVKDATQKVPRIRACPKCLTTLSYTKACKHMHCLCCPHEFCFNCLGHWKKECKHGNQCERKAIQHFS